MAASSTSPRRTAIACLRLVVETAPSRTALVLALLLAGFLTEGFGLLLLVPLMGVVGLDVGQEELGGISAFVTRVFDAVSLRPTLPSVLIIYVAVNAARVLLERWKTIAAEELDYTVITELRRRLYRAISYLPWLQFVRRRSSDLTNALTSELDRVAHAISELLRLASQAVIAVVYAALAFFVSPIMTTVAIVAGGALSLSLTRGHRGATRAGEDISSGTDELYSAVTQHLGAIKVTKSFGAEERNLASFVDVSTRAASAYIHVLRDYTRVSTVHAMGAVLILAGLVYIAVEMLRLPVAAILLLLFLFARLVPRISALHQSYYSALSALPAFARVTALIDEFDAHAEEPESGTERIELDDRVSVSNVDFSYEPNGRATLRDISLEIAAQSTTAIVGPSGAGKSTIADLVMGMLKPDRGSILIDGVPLDAARVRSWRNAIGYVPQDAFLFHASVEENLRWAAPGASTSELWEALALAAADDFVRRLPNGLDTVIGDRGALLSSGERQRLALARALLRQPSLLVLDEATSSLDTENERRIQRAIAELHGRLTILIITHRLTTVRNADIIYVVDEGRIVEQGDWDELVSRAGGRFRALCAAMGVAEETPLIPDPIGGS
jgi:ATP-binding cassette subfamily C protein